MVFVPPYAPLVALAFLGAAFLFAAGAVAIFFGLLSRRRAMVVAGAGVAGATLLSYTALWIGSGILSRERVLDAAEWKYFCEIDCHIAYSVARVEHLASIGPDGPSSSDGEFLVVTLATWFDPSTISARRPPGAMLSPNPRVIVAADDVGGRYLPRLDAVAALVRAGRTSTPVTEALKPGDRYETLLVFDVPKGRKDFRLYVGNRPGEAAFLLLHEASPIAKRAWFALG